MFRRKQRTHAHTSTEEVTAPATTSGGDLTRSPAWAGGAQTQMEAEGGGQPAHSSSQVRAAAARGTSDSGGVLPHADRVQQAFGRHDISSVTAHQGRLAIDACNDMGASAYAQGEHVVFGHDAPSLHMAAHEAAHVIQQRGGITLPGGVGQAGDAYEQHADAVADAVVAGQSAEPLLNQTGGDTVQQSAVQAASEPVQMEPVSAVAIASLVVGIVGTLISAGSVAYTVAEAKNNEITGGVERVLGFGGKFFITSLHEAYLKSMGEVLIRQELDRRDPGWQARGETDHLQAAKNAAEITMQEKMADKTSLQVWGAYAWAGDDTRTGREIRPGGGASFTLQAGYLYNLN